MRMTRTTDSKENLCDTCSTLGGIPHCMPDDVEFGDGFGNDNVVACKNCTSPYSKTIYPSELRPSDKAMKGESHEFQKKRTEHRHGERD